MSTNFTDPSDMSQATSAPALVLIDLQKGMDAWDHWGGTRNNPQAETVAASLLTHWRAQGWPIFHVQHSSTSPTSPLRPGLPGHAIKEEVAPISGEPVIGKTVNSAFIGTDLETRLREAGLSKVVIVGLTTEHCISTSVRMSANLGFETYLIEDAIAAFPKIGRNGKSYSAEMVHQIELANLEGEFATVLTGEALLQLWPGITAS
ncbi:MAG: cysteine hydrolase family protein [Bacteroidota bacterium]